MRQRDPTMRFSRTINAFVLGFTLLITLAVPVSYFLAGYQYQRGNIRSQLDTKGYLVQQIISNNPDYWAFENVRLESAILKTLDSHQDGPAETHHILNLDRQEVAVAATPIAPSPPLLSDERPLYASNEVVGYYKIVTSFRPLLVKTGIALVLCLAAESLLMWVWIVLPLRTMRRAEQRLSQLAHFDSLTGLANRSTFERRLVEACQRTHRRLDHMALVFLDLDHFKSINDTYGHPAGDAVLVETARRLKSAVRESDFVARLAGDEFVVILEGLGHRDEVASVARTLLNAFIPPFELPHQVQHVLSPSMGIALFPDDANAPESLLHCADTAMYRAKNADRNQFHFYKKEVSTVTSE